MLLSDSTNAEVTGATRPESAVPGFLRPIFAATKGRIYVTTFASHVHRIQNVVSLCAEFGRAIAFVGRSMEANASLATRTGHLRVPGPMLVSSREAEKLPPERVCFMVTGSQGEPGSALARIALLQMKGLVPSAGDAVIFSRARFPATTAQSARSSMNSCAWAPRSTTRTSQRCTSRATRAATSCAR